MKAQISILLATALICGALIVTQALRKRDLDNRIAVLREQASSLRATPGAVSPTEQLQVARTPRRIENGDAEQEPSGPEKPAAALAKAVKDMNAMVAGVEDIQSSPGAFFGILPEILKVIEDLDIDGVVALADKLDSGGALFPPRDAKGAARLMLYLLAAEQEPLKLLERKDLQFESPLGGLQDSIFATLAGRDPDAAIRWLEAQEMDDARKTTYLRNIGLGLLASDPRRGLDYLLEHPDSLPQSGMGPLVAGIQLPDAARTGLIEALPDPRYAEIRPFLSKLVMRSSLPTAGIDELRKQAADLELGDAGVASFVRQNPAVLMQKEPQAAMDWMKEALPADEYPAAVATAIRGWTERDFNAAGTFLGTMERGSVRDRSIQQFASVVAWMEPESAATWAAEIEDSALRQSALREVGKSWLRLDPAAASAWMKKQGIPAPDGGNP